MSLVSSSRLLCVLLLCMLLASCLPGKPGLHISLSSNEGGRCVQHWRGAGAAGGCTYPIKCPPAIPDTGVGCLPRHAAINDVIRRAVVSVHVPSVLEPPGLVRDDGKRPDECEQYKLPKPQFGRSFVVGGTSARAFEFPHMAALGWRAQSGDMMFLCGGSLISERFVLTAAHCLVHRYELTEEGPAIVRLGALYVNSSLAAAEGQLDVPIKNRIPHPCFKPPAKYFDIALLELAAEVPFTRHHRPACLWTYPDVAPHVKATITGWGTISNRGKDTSPGLIKVDVDLLDSALCDQLLVSSRSRNWGGFLEHQLCAGSLAGGKDACQGDSGGPLQVIIDSIPKDQYSVIGLTSFGRECGLPNQPGVYTRVSSFLDWIEPIVWPEYNQNVM